MQPSTKGQMQMLEMVAVLVIFFIILSFGAVFYFQYAKGQAQFTLSEVERANLVEMQKLVGSLPEIHCSFKGDEDLSCIDTERAKAFGDLAFGSERLHYSEVFHGYKAEVDCLYNCQEFNATRTLFDYTGTGTDSVESILPRYLYNPLTGHTAYGVIRVIYVP